MNDFSIEVVCILMVVIHENESSCFHRLWFHLLNLTSD